MGKNEIHGWLVMDKPSGISSNNFMFQVKKILRPKKIGHAGTLDPFATGILLIAFGEATKTVGYGMQGSKTYEFEITWGENRDSLDIDGQVTHTSAERPSKSETTEAIKSFCGMISQIPPAFSALKINGQRAYTLAREGKDVELQARDVHIDKLELLEFSEEKAKFKVICGKGFYVRALARDICAKLGVYGYVSSLRRTESYPFKSEDMILLDLLEKVVHNTKPMVLDGLIKPVHAVLDDILVQRITEEEAFAIRLGRSIRTSSKDTIVTAMLNDKVVALCEARDGYLHPKRVFNY